MALTNKWVILPKAAIPVLLKAILNRAAIPVRPKAWLAQLPLLPQAGPAAVAKAATQANSVVLVANPRKSPRLAGPVAVVTLAIPANSALNAASPSRLLLPQAGPAAVAL